ncbi:MAG: hypothetical protein Q7J73_08085 [Dehalococcoidales bacterium]|nr:hypothetical protein [Dehalococcoidales bacterium]
MVVVAFLFFGTIGCTTPSAGTPKYSESEAVSRVKDWLYGQAQSLTAKALVDKETAALNATYRGGGIWEVKGTGIWKLDEKSGTVEPSNVEARVKLKTITDTNDNLAAPDH